MGTTKLTRKEILAEDPVHQAIIQLVELLRERGTTIALGVLAAVVVAIGVYFGIDYMESKEMQAQHQLSRALGLFHARIDASAPEDPYGKGPDPVFRNDAARNQAASKELSSIISRYGSSRLSVIARYYLGLVQLRLGQKDQAVQSLEAVRNNTKDRTLSYLGKKVLAAFYLDSGNYKGAQEILDGMIKDPQCELPREDLKLELSRVFMAQGKRDEAIKILREARDASSKSMLQSMLAQELTRLEGSSGAKQGNLQPSTARP